MKGVACNITEEVKIVRYSGVIRHSVLRFVYNLCMILSEQMRQTDRVVRKTQRDLERDRHDLERQEKKLVRNKNNVLPVMILSLLY